MPDDHLVTPILKSAVKLVIWDLDETFRERYGALRFLMPHHEHGRGAVHLSSNEEQHEIIRMVLHKLLPLAKGGAKIVVPLENTLASVD